MIPYQFEPYNAYAKTDKQKKKHWMQVAEEEALQVRMMMEAQRQAQQQAEYEALLKEAALREAMQMFREAKTQQMTVQDSVQNGETAAQTMVNMAPGAGAGGTPPYSFFKNLQDEGSELASFTISPTGGIGPLPVTFTNTSRTPDDDTFYWLITGSSGNTYATWAFANPPIIQFDTGSYTIILQETSSVGNMSTAQTFLSVSVPVVTPRFSFVTSSNYGPTTASFTNLSTNTATGGSPATYKWVFTDNVNWTVTSSATNPVIYPVPSGSITASLNTTGSYNIRSGSAIAMWVESVPTLTSTLTAQTSSNTAPATGSFTASFAYAGNGVVNGRLYWGDGSGFAVVSSFNQNPLYIEHGYDAAGPYTASLEVTESTYNIAPVQKVYKFELA